MSNARILEGYLFLALIELVHEALSEYLIQVDCALVLESYSE